MILSERKLTLFEVRPTADWLVDQESDTRNTHIGRFLGGLCTELDIDEHDFDKTFQSAERPILEKFSPEQFLLKVDELKLNPIQVVRMGVLASNEGLEFVPIAA